MRPLSLDGDWNRLYSEFPEIYDAFARVEHAPRTIDVVAGRIALDGAFVLDVGAGTGRSTLELAARAGRVVGVEPNDAMLAVARQAVSAANAELVSGDATSLPAADGDVDVVACFTTVFWPPEEVVPRFAAEARRVLRPGGSAFSLNTAPDWYGGEFHDVVPGSPEYEHAVDRVLADNGFEAFDFETTQTYESPQHAAETYGFIFGRAAVERLLERGQRTVAWKWRLRTLTV